LSRPHEPDEVATTLRGWPVFVVSSAWRRAKRAIKHSALLWGIAVRVRDDRGAAREVRGAEGTAE
jgi:hypothetical protein